MHRGPAVKRRAAWPTHVNFEWHGRTDDARQEPKGDWVIGAGASFPLAEEPDESSHRKWYAASHTRGFEVGSGPHATYLFRYLPLNKLAGGDTLSSQASRLADWVLGTWSLLDALPPTTDGEDLPDNRVNPDLMIDHLVNDVVDEHGVPYPLGRLLEDSDYVEGVPRETREP